MRDRVELEFAVEGMTCAACAARLTRVLSRAPGVEQASVNFATASAFVTVGRSGDPEAPGLGELRRLVQAAGFEVPRDLGRPAADQAEDERRQEQHSIRVWGLRSGLAALASLGVMALSMGWLPGLAGDSLSARGAAAAAAGAVVWGAGWPFWRGAFAALRHRTATMDTLVALGSGSAFLWSTWQLRQGGEVWFDSAAMLVTFLLVGRTLEARARGRASEAIRGLLDLRVPMASVLRGDGVEVELRVEQLEPGDRVVLGPGARVPVDGCVEEGRSSLDTSAMTGEPMPVDAGPGTELMAGTLNGNGRLVFRVLRSGAESALERVILMVREAQRETAPIQRLADRVSEVFVPAVLVIAALTALGWMAGGAESETVLRRFVTVVIVACPCALGLATPTAILVGTGIGARMGLLVRGASALERAEQITHVALDKTGTLTHGTPEITRVVGDVLELAARAEQPSEHPLAGAVLARARQEGVALTAPESFEALPGLGVRADVEGRAVRVGSLRFLRQEGVSGLGQLELDAAEARSLGESLLFVAVDGCARGFLAASDPARPEAGAVVDWLVRRGLSVHVLSGDSEPAVRAVAVGLGIGDEAVHASLLPGDKLSVLEELRGGGATVAMVGDGINDAPSLAAADLGIALGGGADVALEAADVALMSADLRGVARTIALGTATLRTVRQNLAWAFAYNLLLIPVAAGALVPVGVEIGPAWAAAAMAMSSVTVVANALRLRRVDVSLAGELA